ncbi:MFS general substrate transporter [Cladophialophora carrionii]|uniref:MFS general substrate transporter n=1 Tax=Cladophialophora carrionii TaxID=86049 RepID=A0A1C1CZR2_9EURO|nr:MFS general substrate transporter [Cladophialophora carrionii]
MESSQSKAEVTYMEEGKGSSQEAADNAAEVDVQREATGDLKLDKHGLPLSPQPTDRKDDPLNWSPSLKLFVLLQVSFLAFLGPMAGAIVNPAFVPLSKEFNITVVQASYELTVYIVFAGIGPLFTVPLANVYGRRPVYILGNLLAAVTNIAAGYCNTWTGIMVTRAFNGIGAGSPTAIGAATICDLYFMHERGFYMGIFTFFLTNGPHAASLFGGFIAQNLGWRKCFLIPGYIQLGTCIFTIFCLPETIYSRRTIANQRERSFMDLLLFRKSTLQDRRLKFSDFLRPFYMLKYVAIVVPGLYYMTAFGFGSVMFAATGSQLFRSLYHFNVAQTGMLLSIPLLIGCLIGEMNAGWLTDWMVYRYAKRNGGRREPEPRINALALAALCPIGIIIDGVCLSHYRTTSWVGAAFGMGIANFGLQIATTVTYTYCTDCYKPQSSEISSILNVFRNVFSMTISFYAIPLGEKIQFQYAWLTFTMIHIVFMIPMVLLRFKGIQWRNSSWQKPPTFHNDI